MKVAERVLDVTSTLEGEQIGMTIDQDALAHIMSVLTDLYSDPEAAIIREYATNALDAHVVAGVTRPIEVTLPSPLSPFLRIRDFGIGLNAEDIRDIYSRYGTSTKRESDDVVGMLGLGCKSALTYTDQFTLTGIRDGVMTQVSISRDADGAGSMTIVAEHATDDLSGVEVVIPAKRNNALASKAEQFFSYWTPGTVLVDGEQPARVDGIWLDDRTLLADQPGRYVVMGNVPYPVPDEIESWPWMPFRRGLVRFVDIGTVQFTPSREALQLTRATREALDAIGADLTATLEDSLRDKCENAPDAEAALEVYREAEGLKVSTSDFTWQGRPVIVNIDRDNDEGVLVAYHTTWRGRGRKAGERITVVPIAHRSLPTLFFEGFEGAGLTDVRRAKLEQYLAGDNDVMGSRWVFAKSYTKAERFWLGRVIQWPDVDATLLPKTGNGGRAVSGKYVGRTPAGDWTTELDAAKIDPSKPLLWHHGNRWEVQATRAYRAGAVPVDAYLVALPRNRSDKFRRDFPHAQELMTYVREDAKRALDGVNEDDLRGATLMQSRWAGILNSLDAGRVDDPGLREVVLLTQRPGVGEARNRLAEAQKWTAATSVADQSTPLDKYPLLLVHFTSWTSLPEDDVYIYLNAAYAARKEA